MIQCMGSLKKALFWSALERLSFQGISFLLTIVMARLLSPHEYGLIGMLSVFFGIGYAFADSGLSKALVQRQINSADDEATVFYLNVFVGFILTVFMCAVSPFVSWFYGQPILTPLLCILSLTIFFSSFGIIQYSIMARRMDFKSHAIASIASIILSGVIGIIMALRGWGVWSLAGQSVSSAFIGSITVWKLGKWRLSGRFRTKSFQEMWPFSSKLLAASLLNAIFANLYNIVIGRIYKPSELGLFTRAHTISKFPADFTTSIFSRTLFPAFSRIQDNPLILKVNFRNICCLLSTFHFPSMVGLAIIADPLVRILLTDKWELCIPYLKVLAVAGMFYPLQALHLNALMAKGRGDLILKIEVVKKILTVATILLTFKFGVYAMALGILLHSFTCLLLNIYYTHKIMDYFWQEQAIDLAPVIGATLAMAVPMLAINLLVSFDFLCFMSFIDLKNPLPKLLIQLVTGSIIYGLVVFLIPFNTFLDVRKQLLFYIKNALN